MKVRKMVRQEAMRRHRRAIIDKIDSKPWNQGRLLSESWEDVEGPAWHEPRRWVRDDSRMPRAGAQGGALGLNVLSPDQHGHCGASSVCAYYEAGTVLDDELDALLNGGGMVCEEPESWYADAYLQVPANVPLQVEFGAQNADVPTATALIRGIPIWMPEPRMGEEIESHRHYETRRGIQRRWSKA